MLKESRKKAGMTQSQLADEIGVWQGCVANYEAGIRTPSLKTAVAIIEALKKRKVKMDISELLLS
jgi:putative transcriptional regulator